MGYDSDDILGSFFTMSDDDRKNYDALKVKFERAKFVLCVQKEGESAANFIPNLYIYTLAEHCQFGALHDAFITDRIVVELRDKALSEKLQLQLDLTLEVAINQAS